MPIASQTSRNPGPAASSAASGVSMPALAEAMAAQPVLSTMHLALDEFARQGVDVGVGLGPRIVAADDARQCP